MRIRNVAAAGLLAGWLLVGWAGPAVAGGTPTTEAGAAEGETVNEAGEDVGGEEGEIAESGHSEETEISHAAEECIHVLEAGGSVDDCHEAPSPILPPTNELIWGSISFTILFLALAKFAYPAIKKSMEARTERIRTDLESAETAKVDASRVLEEYRGQLADAKAEAGRIIEEARQQADALRRDLEARAQADANAIRERAAVDAESAKAQAMADLRNDVAQLVSEGVDTVVRGGIDDAAKGRLVDQYIESLAGRSN